MSVFGRFAPRLQHAIASRLGWTTLRPVQELAGEALLDGENAVVLAPTAGGKTEAAMFPALSLLVERPTAAVGVIYVAPIKALLNNQAERLGRYTEMVGLSRFVWHGDAKAADKRRFVDEPAELLMTTPESLEVMLVSSRVPVRRLFADLRMVVIDEVHALAGSDRGAHLMSVIERITALSEHDVQRVGLSATVGNPDAILGWVKGSSARAGRVVDPPKEPARRELLVVERESIPELARDAAAMARGGKSLFFCQSRAITEVVAEQMRGAGTAVFVHHSSVSAEEREAAEARFHRGSDACIVCTSTLELGIDVGDLDRVLQAEAPDTVGSFLQRMGRTGRRQGQIANTTFFCTSQETVLQAIALIELARDGWVEPVGVDERCWPVLVHQLLAMSLAQGGFQREHAWALLSRVPDFSGIARPEFDEVVEHMTREDYLFEAGGRHALGDKAERVYGRKNFMELYAVFSSPVHYAVVTPAGKDIGYLDQNFVDRLVEDQSSFLLGGRPWLVELVEHRERRVKVTPAPRGKQPSWGGFVPQFLGFELCQRIRTVLSGDEDFPYLHASARASLQARRDEMGPLLGQEPAPLIAESGQTTWWTFAGGRINGTVKHALEHLGPWKVLADNFAVRIKGDDFRHADIVEARGKLREATFWEDEATWTTIRRRLPPYRLSKFQQALPEWAQREMLEGFLLDRDAARAICSR